MDNTLLIAIVALILGLIFGWLLARMTGRGGVNELETRLRQAQSAADGAKRDFTNLQSELNIKQTHINTLNSNIGILEEKLRLAEAGGQAEMATITRLQGELKTASVDKPAFEAELRDRDTELSRVRAQLEAQREEAVDLWRQLQTAEAATADVRSQLDAIEANNAQREAMRLAAMFEAAQLASMRESLAPAQEELEAADDDDLVATLRPAADLGELEAANKQIFDLKDGIATLAFAGAELAGVYEKRTTDYDELLAQLNSGSRTVVIEKAAPLHESHEGLGAAAKVGLVAGGVALAGAAEAGPSAEELNAQIETLKSQYAALQADLQTETKSKANLTGELQARLTELDGLKGQIADVTADVDGLIGVTPDGAQVEVPADLKAKLGLIKGNINNLSSLRAELESRLQSGDIELGGLRKKLFSLDGVLSGILGMQAQLKEATANGDAQPATEAATGTGG